MKFLDLWKTNYPRVQGRKTPVRSKYKRFIRLDFGTGLLERVGTGIVGTIGYVVLPTGVSTDVSRDIV